MALYLVIHSPEDPDHTASAPPTRLVELARHAGAAEAPVRWISTLTPDLQDERIFTLWEADDPENIRAIMERFGFLNHMASQPIQVQQWGPSEVLAAASDSSRP